MEPLYSITSNGKKVTYWQITTEGSSYTINTGFLDGKKQTFKTNVIDKKNSSTLEDQAISEADSLWNLKRKTMYPTIEEAKQANKDKSLALGGYKPMLAEELNIKKPSFSIPGCFEQPKLDGIRCIARKVGGRVYLYARSGALKETTPHINIQLCEVMNDGEIWDGEIYKHGMELDDILSLVQSSKNRKDTSQLEYHIYDYPRIGDLNEMSSFSSRLDAFKNRFADSTIHDNIVAVKTLTVGSFKEVEQYHSEFVEDGYEGAILRNPIACYENRRTKHLLKFKKFQDAEFIITGVYEGKGKMAEHGIFICKTDGGKEFTVKMSGDTEKLREYLNHPEYVVGKMLTVKFFSMKDNGVPRFPVGIRIREHV